MATANSTVARPALDIDREVTAMQRMTVNQLRGKFAEVFGEGTNSRNKAWMIKRIAWRMQANVYGGLSERALARARELANFADLRLMAPRSRPDGDESAKRAKRLPAKLLPSTTFLPGTMLTREYKGRTIQVIALESGFEFDGTRYRSLTAIAKAVTGKHWNGFHFFGLRQKAGAK